MAIIREINYSTALVCEIQFERLLIFSRCLDRCNERYSCHAWNICFIIPKYCSDINFHCRHMHENVPFACMNPVLMKLPTRVVNLHSNMLGYTRQLTVAATVSFHTIYCVKTDGSSWSVLNESCYIVFTVEKFEILYNSTLKILLQSFENIRFSHYSLVNLLCLACHVKSSRVPHWARVP